MNSLLIFNFDGTGNEPEDASQNIKYQAKKEDDNISNVLKLHFMFGGNLFLSGEKYGLSTLDNVSRCFYYQGIGTYGSWLKRALNQGLSMEGDDVANILNKAKNDFDRTYDKLGGGTIIVTGFSRGAALARRFVSILAKDNTIDTHPNVFLCVFDTVASIGLPNMSTSCRPDSEVVFEDGCTVSPWVKQALHMVSLDDKRRAFQPTLMNYDPVRIQEIWFAGAHSDVGGGYYRDGLSDVVLSHAMKWLEHIGRTELEMPLLTLLPLEQLHIDAACPTRLHGMIGVDDLQRNPNPMGKNHQQDRWPIFDWFTLDDRVCCVIQNDKMVESSDIVPLIHNAVAERLHRDDDYRPKSLSNRGHLVWYDFLNAPEASDNYETHIHYARVNWLGLSVGDTVERSVEADRFYNFTGLCVENGQKYQITVIDPNDRWHDGKDISCDGFGWNCDTEKLGPVELPIRFSKRFRRVPEADCFALCASIDSDDTYAKSIGQDGDFSIEKQGELVLFANDLKAKYGNNSGSLRVQIIRIS